MSYGSGPIKMQSSQPPQAWSQWPNRILILSLIGIAYLTLFPFRFDFAFPQSRNSSPCILGPPLKHSDSVQVFLNVLLFVPFGFGFSAHLRKRGVSKGLTLVLALAAGAVTSYAVEFLQFYIPTRNSGWDDITPNTLGAVAGCLLFGQWGEMLLTPLSEWESRAETWLSLRRASIFLLAYLGIFIILSIPMQRETRLSNWDTAVLMFVGSDGNARHAWKGRIAKLHVWNRACSENVARTRTSDNPAPGSQTAWLPSTALTRAAPD